MKLANMVGGTSSDIVSARGNVDVKAAQRHEEEQLAKRIQEEAGEVKKRKCTPIEYLLLFGCAPNLDQVQIMTMDDLTREDARQLLQAGVSKCQLLKLYGVKHPGGPHYRQLERLLQPAEIIEQEQVNITEGITWIEPACPSKIRVNKYGVIFINSTAVGIAPAPHQEGCRAKIGVDGTQKALIIMPENNGSFVLKRRGKTLSVTSIAVIRALQAADISIPAAFDAIWDDKMQAWMGQLGRRSKNGNR